LRASDRRPTAPRFAAAAAAAAGHRCPPLLCPSTPPSQLLEATRELITEANFEVSNTGISLQAMDSSHVSLVALQLRSDGFEHFRCDRTFSMGGFHGWVGGSTGMRMPAHCCWPCMCLFKAQALGSSRSAAWNLEP